ncbi:hypothetical protein [Chryseobacterium luteum]|uniref:hypothetical protein n=1 Tax=Chryseobacterium luteum TaxID=421531 RepID=UPI000AF4F61E|nr:hypothetical protein [Chryseobacterium luteum]
MEKITNYIRTNWVLFLIGSFFVSGFVYLTFTGNKFCDCAKTETYRDGTTRNHSTGIGFYRYYHK